VKSAKAERRRRESSSSANSISEYSVSSMVHITGRERPPDENFCGDVEVSLTTERMRSIGTLNQHFEGLGYWSIETNEVMDGIGILCKGVVTGA